MTSEYSAFVYIKIYHFNEDDYVHYSFYRRIHLSYAITIKIMLSGENNGLFLVWIGQTAEFRDCLALYGHLGTCPVLISTAT